MDDARPFLKSVCDTPGILERFARKPAPVVLVTGASGFIGTSLRRTLDGLGAPAIAVQAGQRETAERLRCKLLCRELTDALRGHPIDVVFHLAGAGLPQAPHSSPHYQYWANIATTEALTHAIQAAGFRGRVVFASSASVYGNSGLRRMNEDDPLTPCTQYGHAKAEAESCLLDRLRQQCDLRIARLFHVFGPGQRKLVVYDLVSRLLTGQQPLVVNGTGEEVRDFVFVEDAVRALLFLGTELPIGSGPQIVNVCTGVATRIGNLARLLLTLASRRESDLCFTCPAVANPVTACVGNPERLATMGMTLSPASARHLLATLTWIQSELSR